MIESTRKNDRIIGTLRSVDGHGVVRMEDRFATDVDDLWSAVTDPERLARWIAVVEGDLRLGGSFRAHFTSGWDGPGRIDACEPPRMLSATMSPGADDETVIEMRLTADGDETALVIEESGIPVDELAAHGAGWQVHVEDLRAHLDGGGSSDWHGRWTELTPAYQQLAEVSG